MGLLNLLADGLDLPDRVTVLFIQTGLHSLTKWQGQSSVCKKAFDLNVEK